MARGIEFSTASMPYLFIENQEEPEDWTKLADKSRRLLSEDYDWSEDVAAMEAPTMIVVGDADGLRTAHAV